MEDSTMAGKNTKGNTYELKIVGSFVRIYINGLLHIAFRQEDYLGVQTYKEGINAYYIEFYVGGREIQSSYDSVDKWKSILKLIDEYL